MLRKVFGNGISLTSRLSLFYSKLLKWQSEFREDFAFPKDCHTKTTYSYSRVTLILVRRVSLLGRPSGYTAFVPQMRSLRNGLRSCVTTWLRGDTIRTTWKERSIGPIGFLGQTPLGMSSPLTTTVFHLLHFIRHCPILERFCTDYTLF